MSALDLKIIAQIAQGRFGMFDAACPQCGPERRRPVNQRKPVLRVWRIDQRFRVLPLRAVRHERPRPRRLDCAH